jgi:hypothetical protein
VEYRQYIDKFSAGSHTFNFSVEQPPCLALVPFLEKREISAFKTLWGSLRESAGIRV